MYKCKPTILTLFCWNIISLLVWALLLYQVFFFTSPFSPCTTPALEEAHNVQQQHCHFESTCVNRARWLHYDAASPWDRDISTATPLLFSLRCLILFGRKYSCTRFVVKWAHQRDRSLRKSEHCWEIAFILIYLSSLVLFYAKQQVDYRCTRLFDCRNRLHFMTAACTNFLCVKLFSKLLLESCLNKPKCVHVHKSNAEVTKTARTCLWVWITKILIIL